MKRLLPIFLVLMSFAIQAAARERVKAGDEVFLEKHLNLIRGKSIGIITNQSGELQDGRHIVDVLAHVPGVKLVALFAPEHGIRGKASAGEDISSGIDKQTGVPVYSLYGKTKKPTPQMLKGIDILIYDIQDVGTRFYTFISTLDYCLEAAAENHIKFIVLDKPDMLRADLVDGPMLVDSLRSFIGIQPIPSVYGMTPGELATMMNDDGMLKGGVKADLTVIRMENYRRNMWYDETGLKWIVPSPNLPDMNAVEVYPGNVLLEATNVSEGRGTEHPFEIIGAPYIDSEKLISLLDKQKLSGVTFQPADFTPRALPAAGEPKYLGELCHGVKVVVTGRNSLKPVEMGVTLVWAIRKLYPQEFKFIPSYFDRLAGTSSMRSMLEDGKTPLEIFASWRKDNKRFEILRKKYLLYR
ncbi:MAG: hypothetical protein B7Z63_01185 [Ignavibacteriae bacterium 37-53-5]|nr:MAG: hypothetical protein B7Z63_01185 [Ignavibacteriae bacterium 37-53-5]